MEQAGSGCGCQVTGPKAQAELREEHRWSTGTFVPGRLEVCSAQLRSRRAAVRWQRAHGRSPTQTEAVARH